MFNHFINLNIKIKHCLNKSQVYFIILLIQRHIDKHLADMKSDTWPSLFQTMLTADPYPE